MYVGVYAYELLLQQLTTSFFPHFSKGMMYYTIEKLR